MAVSAAGNGVPGPIREFLACPTPDAWVREAASRLPELLNDHANCELKAASTALGFIYRYPDRPALCDRMSRLAREELRHFEQVRKLMGRIDVGFRKLTASRYAGGLRDAARAREPGRLLDGLLVGALIEARSCERFAVVAPTLPAEAGRFYQGLLASEARHFAVYLELARTETGAGAGEIDDRLGELRAVEADLVTAADDEFRFHSGVPGS